MTDTIVDRLSGVSEGLAVKAPARVATTANITLSGLQTIDGVTVVADDRVLVWQQTDAAENGIYAASSGNWTRTADFDGNRDVVKGTRVYVTSGVTYDKNEFVVTSANPIVIDDDDIDFEQVISTATTLGYTYGSGGDFATLQEAIDALDDWPVSQDAEFTLTGTTGTITTASGDIAVVPASLAPHLNITAPTPATVSITGVYSRSGDAGVYSVTYTATSVAGIAVGQYAHIKSLVGTNNGMRWGFVGTDVALGVGLNLGALYLASTTATFASAPAGKLTTDDAILVGPQLLALSAVSASPSLTATTSAAGQPDISFGHSYWYALRRQSGKTVSTAGSSTTITGSAGTTFTTTAEAGAIIIGHGWARRIVSVTNDLNIVVDRAINLSSQHFVIRPAIYLHQGAYEITAVDAVNNRFTVTNTTKQANTYAPPPTIGLASATATVVKTVLKQSGSGDGIIVNGGGHLKSLTNVAIIGPDGTVSTSGVGINLTGESGTEPSSFGGGSNLIVCGWGIGVSINGGISHAEGIALTNNYICASIYANGFINLDYASVTAFTLYGVFASQGGFEYGAAVFAGGGAGISAYIASAADGHTDLAIWEYCGTTTSSYNLFVEGGGYTHSCPGWFFGGKGNHVYMGKDAGGRASGLLSICAGQTALLVSDSSFEAATATILGATLSGAQFTRANIDFQYAGVGGCGGTNVVVGGGEVGMTSSVIRDGGASNISALTGAYVDATSSYSRGAQSGYDYVSTGARTVIDPTSFAYASSTFSLSGGVSIETFSGSGTSTKPLWATTCEVYLVGGGGGGGSGRRGAAGSVRCGGGGGGGGGLTRIMFPASLLTSTISVTVGAGGAGGAAKSVNDTDGSAGTTGGDTTFGSFIKAFGGVGGSGGTATSGTAGAGGSGTFNGGAGGAASTTGLVGVNGTGVGYAAGGGASGGGLTAADAQSNGGAGGSYAFAFGTSNATAGTAPSGAGGAAASPQATLTSIPIGGGGGGGGGSGAAAAGGTGGAGSLCGGGGGGGGASLNGNNSGAGGAGADGFAMVIWR